MKEGGNEENERRETCRTEKKRQRIMENTETRIKEKKRKRSEKKK